MEEKLCSNYFANDNESNIFWPEEAKVPAFIQPNLVRTSWFQDISLSFTREIL